MTKLFIISLCFLCPLWLYSSCRSLSAVALAKADALVPLWLCLLSFTTVESALQIKLFMQNKAKFRKSQMNVSDYITMEYEIMDTWWSGKKQSQTNPNKAKLKKAKMNVNKVLAKNYENKPPIRAPKKQSQTSKRQKPMQPSLPQRIMKKPRFRVPTKQTQTNPISKAKKDTAAFADWRFYLKL